MNRRGTGAIFCLISAMLFASKYLCAAIFGSGVNSWDEGLFQAMFSYVGNGLTICSVIALAVGIFYLVWAEISKEK